jgi:hypothetical protein
MQPDQAFLCNCRVRVGRVGFALVAGAAAALAGGCGKVTNPNVDAATGDAGQQVDAAIDTPVNLCDPNNDGLKETASCQTGKTYLRFINATASDILSVYANSATSPVTAQLLPKGEFTVGPVDIGLHSLEFRGNQIAMGEVNTMTDTRWTAVAYRGVSGAQTLTFASGSQLATGACGADSAQVAFGQFTSIASNPVVILYSTDNAATWHAPISPGLNTGAIFGSGCWSPGQILFGVGPANATTPTVRFAPVSFTATLTYQMMITDTEIIRVDNLDRVDRLAKQ